MTSPPGNSDIPTVNQRGVASSRTGPSGTVGEADGLAASLPREVAAAGAEAHAARGAELTPGPGAGRGLGAEGVCLPGGPNPEIDRPEPPGCFPPWGSGRGPGTSFPGEAPPRFPEVGEVFGEFRLVAELGRGGQGRVFLATHRDLADRPLVLKITPRDGQEHLALARLQHTHIVPLFWAWDDPGRDLRVLVMPYLGGVTLKQLFRALARQQLRRAFSQTPRPRVSGKDILAVLDRYPSVVPLDLPTRGPAREFLARASYPRAVCWLGLCLAEALQYAHERGLVHLDLKPSNVLLAADGQPMLLDFHLARGPLRAGEDRPAWFGGTPDAMSPEQREALAAVRAARPVPAAVDGRSDIYSLGLLLYQALGGREPAAGQAGRPPLYRCNPLVSVGLSDIVHKCLATRPEDRYADAGRLAADLRRHLADLPLRGVPNRSLKERWQKWRRRRPHALTLAGLLLVAAASLLGMGVVNVDQLGRRRQQAEAALAEGRDCLRARDYPGAIRALDRGLEAAPEAPGDGALNQALREELRSARRNEAARQLHLLAEQLRFLFDVKALSRPRMRRLARRCHEVWDQREAIRSHLQAAGPGLREAVRADLLDVALSWADLQVQLAEEGEVAAARRRGLDLLAGAEALCGPSAALDLEREKLAAELGQKEVARRAGRLARARPPRTPWEEYALGRSLFRRGAWRSAEKAFRRVLRDRPENFWANFYAGLCAHRLGRHPEALLDFHACVTLAPAAAECYYNRGLAFAALGRSAEALRDYGRALELKPRLAGAALNRGVLHYRLGHYAEAEADLRRARECGAKPGTVFFNLAVVRLARGDRAGALAFARRALRGTRASPEVRALYERLAGGGG